MKENKNPKISVVIPIYKVEKYLDKCVESVVNQTYKNLEIFLVDDGSPDNCPKMCDDWAKKDKRIKVIHKQNGGLSDARNFGIEKATGDYIMFVDSDDYLDEKICETLLNLNLKHNTDFAMCDAKVIYETPNNNISTPTQEITERVFEKEQIIPLLVKTDIKYLMTAWAKLYIIEIFKNLRYDKGKIHEDEFILHKLLNITNKFVYINEPLYCYLQREGSITHSKLENSYRFVHDAFKARYEFLINETKYYNESITAALFFFRFRYALVKRNKLSKDFLKLHYNSYLEFYKKAKKKNIKDIAFKFFPNLYTFLYNIFRKKKKTS